MQEVNKDMRVITRPKAGYMLRNKICQGGGIICGRSDCQAVECRQYLLLKILEQINVKRKEGGCRNTYGSGLTSGKIPTEVSFRGSCNPGTVMMARTRLVAEKTEETTMV